MKASPGLTAFNSGELSPACEARTDLKQYVTGCYKLENFIPTVQGPVKRRPGSRFVAEVANSANRVFLMEFRRNTTTAFILEWGELYVRFYKNYAQVLSGGVPYQIASPYHAADLFDSKGFAQLVFIQSADVIYMTHRSGTFPPYKLSHFGDTNWTLAPVALLGGPFGQVNPGSNPCIYASASSGSITLTASSNIFDPDGNGDMVGAYIQLTQQDDRSVRPWEPGGGSSSNIGKQWTYNGVNYELLQLPGGNFGTTPPTHLSGEAWDSGTPGHGALWLYRDAGFGFAQITAIGAAPTGSAMVITSITAAKPPVVTVSAIDPGLSNGDLVFISGVLGMTEVNDAFYAVLGISGNTFQLTQNNIDGDGTSGNVDGRYWDAYIGAGIADNRLWTASATVPVQNAQLGIVNRLPLCVVGYANCTSEWAWGAFSMKFGYPTTVSFFRGRLAFGAAGWEYFSVSADFENFSALSPAGLVTDDAAFSVQLPTQDTVNWQVEGQSLLVGTDGAEHVIQEINTGQPLSPNNVTSLSQMRHGSRAVRPVLIGYALLWIQTSGRKMRIMKYQFYVNQYLSEDLAALADHIFELYQPVALAYQQEPDTVVWLLRSDGMLVGLTFNEEQNVIAWSRHPMAGIVESIATIPSPSGAQDDLWMVVKRTINGVTRRYVEYLAPHFVTGNSLVTQSLYSDAGVTVTLGTPGTVVPLPPLADGTCYLAGQTVKVLTDGSLHPDCVVTAGQIVLNYKATVVQVGLQQRAKLTTMPLEGGSQTGTAQGKIKRITDLNVRFLNTLGGEIGREDPDAELSEPPYSVFDKVEMRNPTDPMDEPVPVYNGIWPREEYDFNYPAGQEIEGRITYRNQTPYPATIAGLYPVFTVED